MGKHEKDTSDENTGTREGVIEGSSYSDQFDATYKHGETNQHKDDAD